MDKQIIRKRMLGWTVGQPHSCGGPGMRTKYFQHGKWWHWIGNGPDYFILREV